MSAASTTGSGSLVRGIRSASMRKLCREAIRQGWTATADGRGHVRLTSPGGDRVWISTTANDRAVGHHYQNARASAKRAGLDVRRL